MKISYNEELINKPEEREENDRKVHYVNGKKVSLGWGWKNIELEFEDVFDVITVAGFATSCELSSNNRKDEFFVSRELLMVDIDSGMTIYDLYADNFYLESSAGFYATPSHTDDAHRFRILFRLETPITDSNKLSKVNRALLQLFKQADKACKDTARLFYGNITELKEIRNNLLTDDVVADLVMLDDITQTELPVHEHIDYKPIADTTKAKIIELLCKSAIINYDQWREIAWGLKNGGFAFEDFVAVTQASKKDRTVAEARTLWNGESTGKITIGSVIRIIQLNHGDDCLRQNQNRTTNNIRQSVRDFLGE